MEDEIMLEVSKLLEKTGLENLIPVTPPPGANPDQFLENILINLKSLNARYEKSEALSQVQWLMNNYNIQIDELMERISS
jgi:hypothetical protein